MRIRLAVLALTLAATAVAYLPAMDGEFLLDDQWSVGDALVLHPLDHDLGEWIRSPRPVTTATFAASRALFGTRPRGWHLAGLGVHLAAVLLAWGFARELLGRAGLRDPEGPALAAAALFALHPIQTEAVAYVTQRSEVLASALYLAALLVLLSRDRAATAGRRRWLGAAAVALHALALGAKPIAATLPAAWLLLEAVLPAPGEEGVAPRERLGRRLPLASALLALSALAAWAGVAAAAGSTHAGYGIPALQGTSYLATQLRVIPTYVRLLVWPARQCADWGVAPSRDWLAPGVVAGGLALVASVAAAAWGARRLAGRGGDGAAVGRVAAFAALFFLVAIAPSSSVVPLLDPMAEHRVYLAMLGPATAVSAAAAWALRSLWPRRALLAGASLALAVAGAAGVATAERAAIWRSSLALWSDAAEKAPAKARVQMNLGQALIYAQRPRESLRAHLRARELSGDGTVAPDAVLANLVTAYLTLGMRAEARSEIVESLARTPGAVGWALLAKLDCQDGPDDACERAAAAALALPPAPTVMPAHGLALKWVGSSRLRRGEVAGALDALRRAVGEYESFRPDPEVLLMLAAAEQVSGDLAAACAALARAGDASPSAAYWERVRESYAAIGCAPGAFPAPR